MIENYIFSNNLADMDLALIHSFLSQSYWAKGIPIDVLTSAISNSMCFGILTHSRAQVAFARMITDKATFAYLADVFVVQEHRGKGLSKWLLESILAQPELQGLRRLLLATRDAHGLYSQFSFKPLANPDTFMEIWTPDVYEQAK